MIGCNVHSDPALCLYLRRDMVQAQKANNNRFYVLMINLQLKFAFVSFSPFDSSFSIQALKGSLNAFCEENWIQMLVLCLHERSIKKLLSFVNVNLHSTGSGLLLCLGHGIRHCFQHLLNSIYTVWFMKQNSYCFKRICQYPIFFPFISSVRCMHVCFMYNVLYMCKDAYIT